MSNAEIFGFEEAVWGEIHGDRVKVIKQHVRSARDAAVPPGQSVGFEFYVAEFPFSTVVIGLGGEVGTTERRVDRTRAREEARAEARGRALAASLGTASASVETAAASLDTRLELATRGRETGTRAASTRAASTRAAATRAAPTRAATTRATATRAGTRAGTGTEAGTTTVIAARRRPIGPWQPGFGDLIVVDPEPPPPPPDNEVPFEITFTPPNGLAPIVMTRPRQSQLSSIPSDTARIDPTFYQRGKGRWTISVKNINETGRRIQILLQSIHAITPVSQQDIPLSLVNFLSSVALQKASPTIEYINGEIVVLTPTHFLDLMGVTRTFSLGSAVGSIVEELPTYTPFWAKVMSRTAFIEVIEARKVAIDVEFAEQIRKNPANAAGLFSRRQGAIGACNDSIDRLRAWSDDIAAYCLVLEGMFTNPEVDVRYIGTVAEIENRIPQIGLVFDRHMKFTNVISNLAVDLSPLLTKIALGTAALTLLSGGILAPFALLGGVLLYNSVQEIDVEEMIRQKIRDRGDVIAGYVKRTIERITDIGAFALEAKIHAGAAADGSDVLRIKYFNPSTVRPPRPWRPIDDIVAHPFEVLEIGTGDLEPQPSRGIVLGQPTVVRARSRSARSTRATAATRAGTRITGELAPIVEFPLVPINAEPPGPPPADFLIPAPETLSRLDDHQSIVVVMMENRSFDHYFFDLPTAHPNRGYRRVPASYSNPPPPGFGEPMRPMPNSMIGVGNSLIFFPGNRSSDPNHNDTHTYFQIGGGTDDTQGTGEMRGFAADFAEESDSPQIVMGYFPLDDLPVYKGLAGHYPVCDRWFAALPVGTYPNRLSMLQGNVPFLKNVKMDDPSLGYLEDYSIFDVLNTQGIPWRMFESDIGTIRLYDRFRLDVANVRPYAELDATLAGAAAGGSLPRVMFIEPAFLFGNDDHPPMDVQQGQAFIREVVGKFIQHGLLDQTLFVITYDEHGGYFDHVAPPGTPVARGRRPSAVTADDYGEVESLFPQKPDQAPTSLGVRVPSLVLSKWASARANHTILDHTAILKTILLHNRDRVSTEQFGRFGERVKKRAHLGQVLDRATARTIDYDAVAASIGYEPGPLREAASALVSAPYARLTPEHPGNVTRGIGIPRPRRIVT